MDTSPDKLERYAFLWSIARMVIAAVSLFFGAMPFIYRLGLDSFGYSLLPLFWLISGAAAIYLGYRWYKGGQTVFGSTDQKKKVAFLIMVITGINLGYTAIGNNVGMNLVWDMPIADILFKATAVIYLVVAYHLWTAWKTNGERLFSGSAAVAPAAPSQTTEM